MDGYLILNFRTLGKLVFTVSLRSLRV